MRVRESESNRSSSFHRNHGNAWDARTSNYPLRRLASSANLSYDHPGLTSYFFTNFPDNFGEREMWSVFLKWGRAMDVYIPLKKDKWGRRFGFVRFLEVHNPKLLELKLDKIYIGNQKLRANLSRFSRNQHPKAQGVKHVVANHVGNTVRFGVSYAKVVQDGDGGGKTSTSRYKKTKQRPQTEWSGLTINTTKEDLSWLQGSLVGELSNIQDVPRIQELLYKEGIMGIKAAPMGGTLYF